MSKAIKNPQRVKRAANGHAGAKRRPSREEDSQGNHKRAKGSEEHKQGQSKVFTEEAKDNLSRYTRMKTIYEDEGVTQRTHQFLTKITSTKVLSSQLSVRGFVS